MGLPADLNKLDAAIVWDKNKKTYLFSGDLYWSYDEKKKTVEKGYPQRMMRWRGVPSHLDAAFTWKDGKSRTRQLTENYHKTTYNILLALPFIR